MRRTLKALLMVAIAVGVGVAAAYGAGSSLALSGAAVEAASPAGPEAVMLAPADAGAANSADEGETELFYYSDQRRIPLPVALDRVGVYFDPESCCLSRAAMLAADRDLALRGVRWLRVGLWIVRLRAGLDREAVLDKVRALPETCSVDAATPVFTFGGASETLLTDTFIVSFQPDTTEDQIEALNRAHGVEVVEVKEHHGYDIPSRYLLRAVGASLLETLDVANAYYEDPLTRYSVPNFQQTNILLDANGGWGCRGRLPQPLGEF